ncbi:MAG: KH domain-containing protein [Candidatus Margulisbacteria bacterium]|nr:KH domain-containing protein [Candidatus Margulisiibacteriota bacterium]
MLLKIISLIQNRVNFRVGTNKRIMELPKDMVGYIIGNKGNRIKVLQKESGADIQIRRGDHFAIITGNPGAVALASTAIHLLLARENVGDILTGRVKQITDFCAFIDLGNETRGFLHVSRVVKGRLEQLSTGQVLTVRVLEKDSRYRLVLDEKID